MRSRAIIVCRPDSAAMLSPLKAGAELLTLAGGEGTLLDRASGLPETFDTVASKPDDLAAIIYTSGTTGRSKGAMLTHRNLGSNALALVDCWGFTRGDVLLHALPIYHVHGLFVAIHCALLSGCRMLWLAKFDPRRGARAAAARHGDDGRADVLHAAARRPGFRRGRLPDPCASSSRARRRCSPKPSARSGSAPGSRILERYGMSETGMNTSNPLVGERIAGTVGPPLPGVSLRITGDDGGRGAAGDIGGIEVKGPNVFTGYWRMPEKTREEFTADGFFRTGDVGEVLPNGYLRIVGRAKDLIISGGLNVYPKEVEERIDALPGVVESAVIGVPDADFGEAVTAVVVARSGHALTESGVISALKAEIAGFKVPKHVHFVDELPRNAMGKVQKNALREKYS